MNLYVFLTGLYTLLIAASFFSPLVATQVLVFFTYFRPAERMLLPYPISFVILLICMFILLFHKKNYKYKLLSEQRRDSLFVIIMELYLMFNILIFNRWNMVELYRTDVLPALIIFFMITEFITTTKRLKYIFIVLIVSAVIICLDSLNGHFNIDKGLDAWNLYHSGSAGRLVNLGWWDNPNKLGFLSNIGVMSCVILAGLTSSNIMRIVYLSPIVAFFPVIFLTGSRGALLQLGVSGGFFLLQSKKKIVVFILAIIIIVVSLQFEEDFSPERKYAEASALRRMDIIYYAKNVFYSHPFMGVGFNLFRENNTYRQVTHNTYLQAFAELGLIGAAILFAMLMKIIKGCLRTIQMTRDKEGYEDIYILSKGVYALSTGCFVYFLFGNQLLDFMFCTIIGLLIAVKRINDLRNTPMNYTQKPSM